MKPWIKILIGVAVGFGVGFGSGFFCHKKMNDVQFEEVTEDEMAEIEASLAQKEKKASDDNFTDFTVKDLSDDVDELRNQMQGKVSYIKADEEAKKQYSGIWDTIKGYSDKENADKMQIYESDTSDGDHDGDDLDPEEGLDEDFLESLELEEVEPGSFADEPVHPIDLGAFYNDRPEYDKVTIDWYEPDDTYMDENEEVIADIENYIGMNPKPLFRSNKNDEDPDVRFIRNPQYHSDYEIIRHHQGWNELTEGRV